jgi:hypothetical protein
MAGALRVHRGSTAPRVRTCGRNGRDSGTASRQHQLRRSREQFDENLRTPDQRRREIDEHRRHLDECRCQLETGGELARAWAEVVPLQVPMTTLPLAP